MAALLHFPAASRGLLAKTHFRGVFVMRRLAVVLSFLFAGLGFAVAQDALTATTTTLSFSPNPVVSGNTTGISLAVKASSGTATPAGTVTVYLGTSKLITATLNGAGTATSSLPTTGVPAGSYSLTAVYSGSSAFATSTSPAVAVTVQSPVSVTLQTVPDPITAGQTAELDALVSATDGGGTPTGTVTFYLGTSALSTVTASNGQALLDVPTTGVPPGSYPLSAKYNGDALHGTGSSAATTIVVQAPGGTACGTGSNGALNGNYAFLLEGFDGTGSIPYQTAGSFVANGSGGILGGEQDFNFFTSTQTATISPLSVYSVGADGRGCITLVTESGTTQTVHTYRIALASISAAAIGQMIEFDNSSGNGITASGKLHSQTTADFSRSALSANYALGVAGWTQNSGAYNHTGAVGAFDLNTTSGAITNLYLDVNEAGSTTFGLAGGTGSFSAVDSHGRAAVELSAGQFVLHYSVYIVGSEFYALSTDTNAVSPVLAGKMHSSGTSFTASNIAGTYAFYGEGAQSSYAFPTQGLGTNVLNAGGAYTITGYYYSDGDAQQQTSTGSLTPASNGRLVFDSNGGTIASIGYLYTTPAQLSAGSAGYLLNADAYASFGGVDVQKSQTYSNAVLASGYWIGNRSQPVPGVQDESGEVTFSSAGNFTGTVDVSSMSKLTPASAFSLGTFAFGANGISVGADLIGVATGADIYVVTENGETNPMQDFTLK